MSGKEVARQIFFFHTEWFLLLTQTLHFSLPKTNKAFPQKRFEQDFLKRLILLTKFPTKEYASTLNTTFEFN